MKRIQLLLLTFGGLVGFQVFGQVGGGVFSGPVGAGLSPSSVVTNGSTSLVKTIYNAGGDGYPPLRAASPDFAGQIGVSMSGTGGAAYFSVASSTNVGGFNSSFYFPDGISQVGKINNSNFYTLQSLSWYVNEDKTNSMQSHARNGSYFFWNNLNPWSDGAGFCVPMYTTNSSIGNPVLTNGDGVVIRVANQFGNQLLTIPSEFTEGETNEAGSYVWLTQPDYPTYISVNKTMAGESGGFYSQHYWMGFDSRGASDSSKPLGIHIPKWTPYVWTYTNVNNLESFFDESTGDFYSYRNIYTKTGGLFVTNSGLSVLGPQSGFVPEGVCPFNFTTNVAFQAFGNSGSFTFDSYANYRLGFVLQPGQYPKLTHGSGAPLIIARSSVSDLHSKSQTLTTEMTVDSHGNLIFSAQTVPPTVTGTDVGLWNSNGVLYSITATGTNKISLP